MEEITESIEVHIVLLDYLLDVLKSYPESSAVLNGFFACIIFLQLAFLFSQLFTRSLDQRIKIYKVFLNFIFSFLFF